MSNHFGIGLTDEFVAFTDQLFFYGGVIFNDAVMNYGNLIIGKKRMRIANFRCPVCSPSGMSNTCGTFNFVFFRLSDQILNTLNRSGTLKLTVIDDSDTAGVVPAVLHATKTFRQNGNNISIADPGNNSAHSLIILISF